MNYFSSKTILNQCNRNHLFDSKIDTQVLSMRVVSNSIKEILCYINLHFIPFSVYNYNNMKYCLINLIVTAGK